MRLYTTPSNTDKKMLKRNTNEKGVNSQGRLKAKKVGMERVWRERSTGWYTGYGSSEMPYVGTIVVIIIENQKYELIYDQSINIFHGKQ